MYAMGKDRWAGRRRSAVYRRSHLAMRTAAIGMRALGVMLLVGCQWPAVTGAVTGQWPCLLRGYDDGKGAQLLEQNLCSTMHMDHA